MARVSAKRARENRAAQLAETLEFLLSYEPDEEQIQAIRAMIIQGGTDEQIEHAMNVTVLNRRIEPEDFGRYSFGVLKNVQDRILGDELDGYDEAVNG